MFYFSPGDCCEAAVCVFYADNFGGADSTDVGIWTEVAGNWTITGTRLHPDHADTDQIAIGDDTTTDISAGLLTFETKLKGQAGDVLGAGLYFTSAVDLDPIASAISGGMYVKAMLKIGSAGAGEFSLAFYQADVMQYTHTVEDFCLLNEYDIPEDTDVTLSVCVQLTPFAWTYVARLTIGDDVYELGFRENTSYSAQRHIPAYFADLAVTGSFDDALVERVDWITGDTAGDCEDCPTCDLGRYWESYVATDFGETGTAVSGTWHTYVDVSEDIGEDCSIPVDVTWPPPSSDYRPAHCCILAAPATYVLFSADDNAIFIANRRWVNDNLEISTHHCPGNVLDVAKNPRLLFSYVDPDNYWCLEFQYTPEDQQTVPTAPAWTYLIFRPRLIRRVGGAETVYWSGNLTLQDSTQSFLWYGVSVHGCRIMYRAMSYYYCILEDAELNNTGRWGVCTGDDAGDGVWFDSAYAQCSRDLDCSPYIYIPDPDDPDSEPEDPPTFLNCCDDEVAVGDEFSVQFFGVGTTIECAADDCIFDTPWINDITANVWTVTITYADENTIIAHGETTVDNPCVLGDGVWAIDLQVIKVKADPDPLCVSYVRLYYTGQGGCDIYFASDPIFTACNHAFFFWRHGNEPPPCCLQGDNGPGSVTINLL